MATSYDLETRTLSFAREIRALIKLLSKNITNIQDAKQLTRSSGSIGANYIEANEALSKKDFIMRIKIARKEAKESEYWLKLLHAENKNLAKNIKPLIQESLELRKIFGAILKKSE